MKKLFWGFLLISLDFSLSFNQHSLNIFPDFMGYLLLIQGTEELEGESGFFGNARPFAVGMAVYTAILWAGALLGIASESGWLSSILDLAAMVVFLYVAWVLNQGVLDMEIQREADLNGGTIYKCWKGLVIVRMVGWLLSLMANLANLTILFTLAVVLGGVGLVLTVLYLVGWWKSASAWEALPDRKTDNTEPE